MVTASMKWKDTYSLEEKLWPTQTAYLKSRDSTLLTKVHLDKAMVFPLVMYGCWTIKKAEHQRIDALNCGVGEDSWESLGLQGDPTSPSSRKSVLNIHWKDWCWSWSSNALVTWWGKLPYWKSPWCWDVPINRQTGYFGILKSFGGLYIGDEIGIPFCFFNSGILISRALS